jgi:hypothetical protein
VRRRAVWFLTFPILLAGETAGHAIYARIIDPHGQRHMILAQTAQDYLEYLCAAAVICAALGLGALCRRVLASFRGQKPHPLPSWHLAALPSAAFVAQEYLEAFLHNGDTAWLVSGEPAVVLGAALQLPFGLLAVWLVRSLLRVADGLGWALARRSARELADRSALDRCRGPQDWPLSLLGLARGLAERAPPSFA